MVTLAIKDQEKRLVIDKLILSNSANEFLDLSLLFTSLTITESIDNRFYMAEIVLNSEYELREKMVLKGDEFLKVSWTTDDDLFRKRVNEFKLLRIDGQKDERENLMEKIILTFIDSRYIDLIKKNEYEIFTNTKPHTIITTMLDKYDIDIDIEDFGSEIAYYWMNDVFKCLDQVRFSTNTPLVIFQQDNDLIGRKWETLFKQDAALFNVSNINAEVVKEDIYYRLKDISHEDIIDLGDFFEDEVGNKLFVRDYWNKSFTYSNKTLNSNSIITSKKKFETNYTPKVRVNFPDYKFVEDYLLNDYIEAIIPYGNSSLYVGMAIELDIPSKFDKNDTSINSGKYLIYTLTHKFDRNLNYSQEVTLIKKDLFKSI